MILFLLLSLLGFFLFVNSKLKCPASLTPCFTFACIIILLEIGGIRHLLQFTAWFLFFLGIVLLILQLPNINQLSGQLKLRHASNHHFIAFMLFYFALYNFTSDSFFGEWDVFSHWGIAVKDLVLQENFFSKSSSFQYKQYPPALTLFQYFFSEILGYSEHAVIFSTLLLTIAPLLLIFRDNADSVTLSKIYKIFLLWILGVFCFSSLAAYHAFSFILIPFLFISLCASRISFPFVGKFLLLIFFICQFFTSLHSAQSDQVVAAWFGGSLMAAYYTKKQKFTFYFFIPIFFLIPIIKQSGLGLSLFSALLFWIQIHIVRFDFKKSFSLMLIFSSIFSKKLWSWYCAHSGINAQIGDDRTAPSITFNSINELLFSKSEHFNIVKGNLVKRFLYIPQNPDLTNSMKENSLNSLFNLLFSNATLVPPFSSFHYFLLLFSMLLISSFFQRKNYLQKKAYLVPLGFSFVTLLYMFGLLFLYCFVLSDREGEGIASYERYLNAFLFGFSIFASYSMFASMDFKQKTQRYFTLFALLLCILLQMPTETYLRGIFEQHFPDWVTGTRMVAARDTKLCINKVLPNKRVFLVMYNTGRAYQYMVHRYEIIPRKVAADWEVHASLEEWAQILKKDYDYVFIVERTPEFVEKFKPIFLNNTPAYANLWEIKPDQSTKYGILLYPIE